MQGDPLPRGKGLLCALAACALAACTTTTTITDDDSTMSAREAAPSRGSASLASEVQSYEVRSGDTLYSIAFRNRVDLRELIAWNELSEPYTIYPGQRLRVQRSVPADPQRRTAPRAVEPALSDTVPQRVARGRVEQPPPPVAETTTNRVAGSGLTLESDVPTRRLVDSTPVSSLAAIPLQSDEPIREAVSGDPTTLPRSSASVVGTRAAPPPVVVPQTPSEPMREIGAGPIGPAPTRTVGGVGWRWPSTATLVGRFSADDDARQGIRMQGPAGAPITASADGEVVYSGNGLVGLGELVIIKHGSEYLSAYGLNRKRLVTEGQKVKAGQLVAEMGNSAGVAGLLHFEVRRNGRPIDPLGVLPPR